MITPPRDATHDATLKRFEAGLVEADTFTYELTLFVSGASELSSRAIANATSLCEKHLAGRYELSIVNLNDDPAAALDANVHAAPTLVRRRPLPVRMIVGTLSQPSRVLLALELSDLDDPSLRG
jgi:circadian clock protein KaiB